MLVPNCILRNKLWTIRIKKPKDNLQAYMFYVCSNIEIFFPGGPRKVEPNWSQDKSLFESWRDGRTGFNNFPSQDN